MIHYLAWLAWIGAAATAVALTRNPLYLLLLLGIYHLVATGVQRPAESTRAPVALGRFALFVIPVTALFNAATAHVGATVLLHLPAGWPLIGGAITAEALVYGAINGLMLTTLLAAFAVLNRALSTRDLIRLAPRAFYPLAVVLSIAVTFVPATLRQLQQIREAQAIRGHRMRGLRDWLPLFMPLLVGGLERAFRLAEALTARGFAADGPSERDPRAQIGTVIGLSALLVGLVLHITGQQPAPAYALLGLGGLLLLAVIRRAGRDVPHTAYRHTPWTARDSLLAARSLVALLPLLLSPATCAYTPYPALTLPPFNPWVGSALLGFVAPIFYTMRTAEPPA